MKLFKGIFLILFFGQTLVQAQELTLLKGKITSQVKELNEVYITNLRSDSNTTTDRSGNFSMFVKVGDTLQFSGLQVVTKKARIDQNDVAKQLYVINLEGKVIPLDEVEVKTYPNINAVSLGILEKPAKHYTPAERKLRAAEEFHWYSPLLIPIGGMSFDGLLNSINGRRTMLQKELKIERKELLLEKIESLFKEEYFLDNLKIPKEYLRGFWYYAVEDPKLIEALNAKNKIMARFIFSDLAVKYLEILKK
ncbi:hypothetical protein [Flavobacterium wongokense]|uniref:hypothetical protein n=1 Tax=Flavobacterium wongokense TaxID=2910674 RepID=UPI001F15AEFE|nr:hypothetical protein [Flavobacterium sp. WG47]MCF6131024.1 hypothetical protein [Flavobacterium sp. WG47]